MSTQKSTIHERLLYIVVREKVKGVINPLLNESGKMAKEFGAETPAARLTILEMIRTAMGEIFLEQKARIEFAAAKQSAGLQDGLREDLGID
jgi:hypothetical protein